MSDPSSDQDLNETPLADLHRRLGARMVPFAGYAMPVQYPAGILAEHAQVRTRAGLFDVSHMGQVTLTGESVEAVAQALETVTPGNIVGLLPGRMRYTVLLSDDGGVIDDLMVTRPAANGPDVALHLVVNADRRDRDITYLRERLAGVDVALHDDLALLALQGPHAAAVLERHAAGASDLRFMSSAQLAFDGVAGIVSRSGYTGEDGFEISVAAADAEAVAKSLLDEDDVEPIGLGARDSLRLEAGLCLYGHDLDETISPVEADLGFTIAKRRREDGDFAGSQRILRELRDGPSRVRVGLKLEGRAPAREGAEIHSTAGERVGVVTSGSFGPTAGAAIAMGYVSPPMATPGPPLVLLVRSRELAATVVELPFVPHRYYKAPA